MNVPSGIRKHIGSDANDTLVFAPGFEVNTLRLYPQDEWTKFTNRFKQFKANDKLAQEFVRKFVGGAHTVSMDSQGRIMLPSRVLDLAQIESEILFIGMVEKLEVWNPQNYAAYKKEKDKSLDELLGDLEFPDGVQL